MLNVEQSSASDFEYALPMPDDLIPPVLSDTALSVLAKRYLRKDAQGHAVEDPMGMFWRVASSVAAAGRKWDGDKAAMVRAREFYEMMAQRLFLPNSPTLMNAGLPGGQLAACFVLPVEDSLESIFETLKSAALVHKSGGGTGFSFSRLRPRDSRVRSTSGVASGPVSFMRVYDTATEEIKQGGRRRGANMGVLRVDHPDIVEFIECKRREDRFQNFNISVALTDEFMQALQEGRAYRLIDPVSGQAAGELDAVTVWNGLVYSAWLRGDPGVIFIDEINRRHIIDEEIEATNPCGESPLLPYEACNLGSINLVRFVLDGEVLWDALRETVSRAVIFLDNVIELSEYPVERIREKVLQTRKIGLGVMGWADMLFQLRIAYDSKEAFELAGKVMGFIQREAIHNTVALAEIRGTFSSTVKEGFWGKTRRNATLTSIAPTGTLSMIAGCSSGIEPLYALAMTKTCLEGEDFYEVNVHFLNALEDAAKDYEDLPDTDVVFLGLNEGRSLAEMGLPEEMCRVFKTAPEIAPKDHLKMQDAFQNHVDLAVSKTINLPNSATREDVAEIYRLAYQLGCKGVTLYRDGCRSEQVLNRGRKKETGGRRQEAGRRRQETGDRGQEEGDTGQDQYAAEISVQSAYFLEPRGARGRQEEGGRSQESGARLAPMKRPKKLNGFTRKVRTGLGELYLTINEFNGKPFEVFATVGKSGKSAMAKAEAVGRLVSLALRSGIEVGEVVKQIRGIAGEHPVFREKGMLLSIPDAVGWILEEYYLKDRKPEADIAPGLDACPDCDGPLVFEEGCKSCKACGWNKCG